MSTPIDAQTIRRAAVLGLGTMGHGIAQTLAAGGCTVRGYDASPEARESLIRRVRANLKQMASVEIVNEDTIPEILARITVCDNEADAVADAQFVTEAVAEDLDLKRELFARLEPLVGPDTILASNTSSYPMTQMAQAMQQPERAVVTHWFNPPHIVPVVEVVPGERTAAATVQTAYDLLQRIGKVPVRVNQEVPGFLVNRVQIAMLREIWDLLDRGVAEPEEIDRAIRGSAGLRLAGFGPLAIVDFAGWDVTTRVYQNLVPHLRSDAQVPDRVRQLLDEGRMGVKNGRGIYDYPPETVDRCVADRDLTLLKLIALLREETND